MRRYNYSQALKKNHLENDTFENIELFLSRGAKFIVKPNLPKEPKERWLALSKALGCPVEPRRGKRVWRGTVSHIIPSESTGLPPYGSGWFLSQN